jgi:inhibitor of the pro-sigma K processing machinery
VEIGVIFATLLLLSVLFLILRVILGPLKAATRIFINCLLALLMMVIINLLGVKLGFHIPLNPVSVLSVGLLGLPGFCLVAFLSFLFY